MLIDTFKDCIEDMESGVYDFTKNGKCSNCGECCSALLPLSEAETKRIKAYVKKHNIKPHKHNRLIAAANTIDIICPFMDSSKEHKCDIYKVRPDICKHFICNVPPSKVEADKALFWKTRKAVYMWDLI